MKNARYEAFKILLKVFKSNAYTNIALDNSLEISELDRRERALASSIVYGTVERMMTLDYIISSFLTQPIEKLKLKVLVILRMSVYQLYFMDKIPPSAAINEAVELTKKCGCSFASSLVNAVLRKCSSDRIDIDSLEESVRFSCPKHLINMWRKMYGDENVSGLLQTINEKAPVTLRVNTLKISQDDLISSFRENGIEAKKTFLENALTIENVGSIASLPQYNDGLFHVQDISSQLCAKALDAQPGENVFDVCSAPGGKTFTVAQYMQNKGVIKSFDIYEHRLKLIDDGSKRLGIDIVETDVNDASVYNEALGFADKVLCDVVCSGLGIIRKKPEIRYKDLDSIKQLPETQYKILEASSKYVKKGGRIVYSTCALNKKENDKVVDLFLKNHSEFVSVRALPEVERAVDENDYLTLFPHVNGCDGFFIAVLERIV